jgi:hypothetical protein
MLIRSFTVVFAGLDTAFDMGFGEARMEFVFQGLLCSR